MFTQQGEHVSSWCPNDVQQLRGELAQPHFFFGSGRTLGVDYGMMEMGGAAGGLAAGLAAFAGAALRMGMELFDELTGLRAQVARSALVITGEGRLDAQSSEGKVVSYVSELAREAGVPVIALCGSVDEHRVSLEGVVPLTESGLPVADCIARPLDALDAVMPALAARARASISPHG